MRKFSRISKLFKVKIQKNEIHNFYYMLKNHQSFRNPIRYQFGISQILNSNLSKILTSNTSALITHNRGRRLYRRHGCSLVSGYQTSYYRTHWDKVGFSHFQLIEIITWAIIRNIFCQNWLFSISHHQKTDSIYQIHVIILILMTGVADEKCWWQVLLPTSNISHQYHFLVYNDIGDRFECLSWCW